MCSNGIDMPIPYEYEGYIDRVVPINKEIKKAFKGGLELLINNKF